MTPETDRGPGAPRDKDPTSVPLEGDLARVPLEPDLASVPLEPDLASVPLYALAHARTGDKGERINIAVFAYEPEAYPWLERGLTESRVMALFAHRGARRVTRYALPRLHALNFVIDGVLEGGVNGSLNLDGHGKSQSFRLLSIEIQAPRALIRRA